MSWLRGTILSKNPQNTYELPSPKLRRALNFKCDSHSFILPNNVQCDCKPMFVKLFYDINVIKLVCALISVAKFCCLTEI